MGMRWVGGPTRSKQRSRAPCERFEAMEMVRFSNTGTEANTYAINTARAVTGRQDTYVYGRLSWRMDSRR